MFCAFTDARLCSLSNLFDGSFDFVVVFLDIVRVSTLSAVSCRRAWTMYKMTTSEEQSLKKEVSADVVVAVVVVVFFSS